jgi:hypothetical protein
MRTESAHYKRASGVKKYPCVPGLDPGPGGRPAPPGPREGARPGLRPAAGRGPGRGAPMDDRGTDYARKAR